MKVTFNNKVMLAIQRFGIQLNMSSLGLVATQPLNIPLLDAGQTLDISLPLICTGSVQITETAGSSPKSKVRVFKDVCAGSFNTVSLSQHGEVGINAMKVMCIIVGF